MRTLATMVEQRRRLVSERIRITNRLRSALKQYYPQVLEWLVGFSFLPLIQVVAHFKNVTFQHAGWKVI